MTYKTRDEIYAAFKAGDITGRQASVLTMRLVGEEYAEATAPTEGGEMPLEEMSIAGQLMTLKESASKDGQLISALYQENHAIKSENELLDGVLKSVISEPSTQENQSSKKGRHFKPRQTIRGSRLRGSR